MGSKFRFKLNGSEMIFDKKNDFINFCQKKYKESENGKLKSKASYSFNDGETWSDISLFKYYRQDIQNEKQPQNENMNNSKKSESKSGWGWGTYLIIVLWIWIGLTFIDSKVKRIDFIHRINTELKKEINKNNQEVVPNTQNNEETITEDNSLDGINEEPIQNEVNFQTETDDNSSSNTYQEPERQQQPEKVNCNSCRGSGNCDECGKIFRVHTWEGNGWKDRNETRLGYVMCSDCSGAGVFYKRSDYPNAGKWEIEKKCYVGNCNSGWKPCNKCNGYGNGTLLGKCRDCKGSGYRN